LALLAAFLLVALMAAAGFAAARNVARELATCAIQARTAEAAAAAESGLEWFHAWAAGPAGQAWLAGLAPGAEAEAPEPPGAPFRVRLRHLGRVPEPDPGADPPADAGEAAGEPERAAALWLVTAEGASRADPDYLQARAALVAARPGSAPRRLAWFAAPGSRRPTSATSR
jgi:hypothetical protein